MTRPDGVALVTGGCSGIGLAIAMQLAQRGYDLILVSQRPQALAQAAAQITAATGVRAHTIALDLARPTAAAELYDAVRERGLTVHILVLNAGFFFFGEVLDADPDRASAMLQLHVVTPSLMARAFGRDLRARRRGHILIMSSISAWVDVPGIALYGSSKRYLRSFAAALRSELGVYGVNVTLVAPGATATPLYDWRVNQALARRLGVMAEADFVAQKAVDGLLAGDAVVIPGTMATVLAHAASLVPRSVIDLVRRRAPWLPRP